MPRTASAVIRSGAGRPGIRAVVMITSCLRGGLGQRLAHLLVLLVGERARVAALGLGVGDEVELQRAAAEARDLLPGGAADVEAGDHRAEPLRGRDRLQAGDAGAEHQHLRRRDGAGGGGHHREEAARLARGEQRRRVAGDVRLRGERVHRLGAGDPRDRLHREAGHPRLGQRLVGLRRGERREVADQDLARAQAADLLDGRDGDLGHDVGAPGVVGGADARPGLRVLGVGVARRPRRRRTRPRPRAPCAVSERDDVGDQRHAALALPGLFGNADPQSGESLSNRRDRRVGSGGRTRRRRAPRGARACAGAARARGWIGETISRSMPAAA